MAAVASTSVAVLYFDNRSRDTADAYLADGLTDEITNQLTRLGRLQVKSRGLVAAQWRRTPDPLDAARRLKLRGTPVATILETQAHFYTGSVNGAKFKNFEYKAKVIGADPAGDLVLKEVYRWRFIALMAMLLASVLTLAGILSGLIPRI